MEGLIVKELVNRTASSPVSTLSLSGEKLLEKMMTLAEELGIPGKEMRNIKREGFYKNTIIKKADFFLKKIAEVLPDGKTLSEVFWVVYDSEVYLKGMLALTPAFIEMLGDPSLSVFEEELEKVSKDTNEMLRIMTKTEEMKAQYAELEEAMPFDVSFEDKYRRKYLYRYAVDGEDIEV